MFPQAIGMAAAFDEEEMMKVGDIIATEGRAKYNEYSSMGQRYLQRTDLLVSQREYFPGSPLGKRP